MTVGVTFSFLIRFVGCSSGVGDASIRFDCGEVGCRAARFVAFFLVGMGVGLGWKAFETDWPTFLKKSPTGSAFTHRPLKKSSTATGNETQRKRIKDLIGSLAFNVKRDFPQGSRIMKSKKSFCVEIFLSLSKWIMQSEQLGSIAGRHHKDFGVIVLWDADRCHNSKRLEQIRNRVPMSDDERVAIQCT